MGFNVSQIKYANCAAFSSHIGFESLSLYVLFSHCKTVSSLQNYYFSFTSYHFWMKKFGKAPNFPLKCFTNPTLQSFKSPLFTAFFLIVHILQCENRYSPPIFISTSNLFGFCQSPPWGSDTPASSSFHKKSEKLPWKESVNADIMPVIKKNFNARAVSSTDS